ncbi:MAG: hypothetical protein ACYCXJ_10055 [Thermoleophilia bacterium]
MKLLKIIYPEFVMSYPAMTVYEFEHFKEEKEVLDYWKSSSIYIICQRPVLYFDEVYCNESKGTISLRIKQRGDEKEVFAEFNMSEFDEDSGENDGFYVNINFFNSVPQTEQPFKNVAGIQILDSNKEFLVWLTPERLLFMYWTGKFEVSLEGDVHDFIRYNVHYIGQAKNQNIWDRLTGHEKLSKVLALEHPFIEGEFSPYELSLIFLKFNGFTEQTVLAPHGSDKIENINGKEMSDKDLGKAFYPSQLDYVRNYAINDCEAFLINLFEPKYNDILYKNYPNIKNGLKSIGYEWVFVNFMLFATLITEEASISVKITPIYESADGE